MLGPKKEVEWKEDRAVCVSEDLGSGSHSATNWLLSGGQFPHLEKEKVVHSQGFSNCVPASTGFL